MKETEQAVAASDDDTNIEELRARLAQAKLEIATLMSDNAELKEKLKEKHDPSIAAKAPLGFVVKVSSCARIVMRAVSFTIRYSRRRMFAAALWLPNSTSISSVMRTTSRES